MIVRNDASFYMNMSANADVSSESQGRHLPNQRLTCIQPPCPKPDTVTGQSWWNYRTAFEKCRQEPH